jgi:hypothetical protein
MRDKHLNTDYVEFLRMASECNEYHSRAYSNLCSEIELPNSRGEITFSKPNELEEDNSILLLM